MLTMERIVAKISIITFAARRMMVSCSMRILLVVAVIGSGAMVRADEELPGSTTDDTIPMAPNPPAVRTPATAALAQNTTPPGSTAVKPAGPNAATPKLPETEVVGESSPSSGPATPGEPGGSGGPGEDRSILAGTIFSSPPANGYDAESSTTGSLINVPAIDLPATVNVVPQAVLADQQVINVDDLVRDIAGAVKTNDSSALRSDAFFLRGFSVTSRDYRKNGFLDPTFTPRDFADVQRVEILQGPASVIYGAGQPSGTVNLITKKPLAEAMQEATVQFGSFGLERYTVDSTGPMNSSGSLLYRVNAAYQDNESFRDFGYNESAFAAPAVTWVIDSDTAITWEAEFVNDRRRFDTGVAAVNGQLTLPISRFLGEPTDFQHFQDYRQSLVFTHRLNDDWTVRVGGYSLFYNTEASGTIPSAPLPGVEFVQPLPPGYLYRTREDIDPFNEQYQSLIANLAGKMEIAGMTHNMVFGTEEGWFTSNAFQGASSLQYYDPLGINPTAPVYGNVPSPLPLPLVYNSTFYQADYGLYFQDLVNVTEHWKVLAGVRYDHADVIFDRSFEPSFGPTRSVEAFDVGTPRIGLIYEPLPEKLSFYAMHSESFDPPDGGPYVETTPLKPEFGQLWEGGIKMKPTDSLTLAAAGYYLVKDNVSVYLADGIHLEQVGGQRSQGVELSAVGKLTQRWSLLANYAYTDTLLSDPTPGSAINGQRALGVPYNSASVWSRYNLIANECRTLGVGLGVVYVGDRLGDYYSPLVLPSYTRWDAGLYYKQGRLDANVYFENIFNETYYTSSINQYEVFPGAPFNFRAQVGYRF